MRRFRLAVAQMGPNNSDDSREEIVGRMVALLQRAKDVGGQFVVFPELAFSTFFPREWHQDREEVYGLYDTEMPNPSVQRLFDVAAAAGIGFYVGYAELTPDGRPFNTSIVVDDTGRLVGKYRKIHLPGHADLRPEAGRQHLEKRYFDIGDLGFSVFELPPSLGGVRIGMGICNDRRWVETYRVLALQGAELVLFGYNTPSANPDWPEAPHLALAQHELCLRAGAYQNAVWVAAAAKCGYEEGNHMIGGSAIVAPSGEIVATSYTEADELVFAEIDLDLAVGYRNAIFDFEAHRRPEHYGLIVDRVGVGEALTPQMENW